MNQHERDDSGNIYFYYNTDNFFWIVSGDNNVFVLQQIRALPSIFNIAGGWFLVANLMVGLQ